MVIILNDDRRKVGKQDSNGVKKSEDDSRYLFEQCPLPMTVLDSNGVVIDCNNEFLELTGITKKEIINQRYENTILEPLKNFRIFSGDNELTEEGEFPESFRVEINRFGYEKIWLELKFSLKSFKDQPLLYIIYRDITQLRESKKEALRLTKTIHQMNALIEYAPLAIILMSQEGKIIRINEASKKLLRYSEEEFLSSKIFDYFPSENAGKMVRYYGESIYDDQTPNKIETQVVRRDGTRVDVEITSAILKILDTRFIQSFISDITSRKRYERNRDLLLDRLNESLKFKSIFLAEMSHDLRTPLNAIIGFSSLLLEESYGPLNESQKDYVNDIFSAADQLDGLIKTILDISKIEIGKLKLNKRRFNLYQLLTQLRSVFKSAYGEKGLYFRIENIERGMNIFADPIRFKQILYNLIDNAIKFTDEGGVTIRVLEREGSWEFQIEDTGIGIAEKDHDVVFREFGRIEDDTREEVPGSGIGLSLTKRLIKLHGGGIWFRSNPGEGTTFYFILPKERKKNEG